MTDLTLPIQIDHDSPPDETLHVTASGLPVLIYNINGGGDRPIHGAVYIDGEWLPRTWLPNGRYEMSAPEHAFDLRDRHQVKRGVWVAWFEDGTGGDSFFRKYATPIEAQNAKHPWGTLRGTAYIKEGDGLDTPADPPLVVDWSKLPEWAEWAAADKNGRVWQYETKPHAPRNETEWLANNLIAGETRQVPPSLFRLAPNFDWRKTLIQRPEDV